MKVHPQIYPVADYEIILYVGHNGINHCRGDGRTIDQLRLSGTPAALLVDVDLGQDHTGGIRGPIDHRGG